MLTKTPKNQILVKMVVRFLRINLFKVLFIKLQYFIAVTSMFWPYSARTLQAFMQNQALALPPPPQHSTLLLYKEKVSRSVPQETQHTLSLLHLQSRRGLLLIYFGENEPKMSKMSNYIIAEIASK